MKKIFYSLVLAIYFLLGCNPDKIEPILPAPPPLSDECELYSYTLKAFFNPSITADYKVEPVEDTLFYIFPHFTDL